MKLKYFLRGLGTGIIFTALIMLAAYMTSGGYKMSDEEIIKEAEKLGMVMEDNSIITPTDTDTENDTTEDVVAKDDTTEAPTEDDSTEDVTTEDTTTEDDTTEDTTTEEKTTANSSEDAVTITVQSGMSSYDVAVLLEAAGIVESASDFDVYLNENGYSTRIEVGEFKVSDDMSYEELAKMLTNG